MMFLYRILTALIYGVLYPWAGLRATTGRRLWRGRLARDLPDQPVDVWLHAASVGETKVIGHLVDYLHERNPELRLHVSVMTRTGFATATKVIGAKASLSMFPLDAVWPMRRALGRLNPRALVVAETEIWPVLVTEACKRGIKIVLVNGRMSAKACRRYGAIRPALRRLLTCYDRFFFKSADDRDRYFQFGVTAANSQVAGDMKFDAPVLPRSEGRIRELRARLGVADGEFLLLAGSTRPGEEAQLLQAYREIKSRCPRFRLALVPRHPERVPEVEGLLDAAGLTGRRYSAGAPGPQPSPEVVPVVDVMGVLGDLYLAADVAFVGGTLVNIGGHNILEPVWARTPVLYGPYINNVREASRYIEQNDYGTGVKSVDELREVTEALIDGRRCFATRDEAQWGRSATAIAGAYLMELCRER